MRLQISVKTLSRPFCPYGQNGCNSFVGLRLLHTWKSNQIVAVWLFDAFLGTESSSWVKVACYGWADATARLCWKGKISPFPVFPPPLAAQLSSCLALALVFLSDSLLSAFYLLTWQDEGEDFLLWTVVSSQVSEFAVSIKCCIVQDPLNGIRGDESMPRKYYRGINFFHVCGKNHHFSMVRNSWKAFFLFFEGAWHFWDSPK